MKVLIIHCVYKYRGGEDTVVNEEMNLLKNSGMDVELLEFSNERRPLLKLLQLPFNLSSYLKTYKKLKTFPADVVHIHNLHFGASPSVIYAIKKKGIPFVTTLHNYRLLCPSATLFNNGSLYLASVSKAFPWDAIKKGVYKNSTLLTFWISLSLKIHQCLGTWKMCSKYIVLTPAAKKLFLRSHLGFNEEKLLIKPNFFSYQLQSSRQDSDFFLYIGRLTDEKGLSLLLDVFSSSSWKIKIAGDGPLQNKVVEFSTRFKNIEFLGVRKKDEVLSLLNTCSALIFPSIWYEGMPLTIIEAFACGTPVIASRLGAMESMISDNYNGLHFEAGNKQDLKNKLEQWQKLRPEQKKAVSNNARKTYEEYYTPEKNLSQLISIYQTVINEKDTTTQLPAQSRVV